MNRERVAVVLGSVALLSVLATAAVAVTRDDAGGPEPEAQPLTVARDGASFEVPADGWRVEDPSVRIFYTDERDRPVAVVRGPAVLDPGYCGTGSNRAFAGFTGQPIEAWAGALGEPGDVDRTRVEVDGREATLQRVTVDVEAGGPCGTPAAEVSMIEADGVRVVLVQDTGALPDDDLLLSLQLP